MGTTVDLFVPIASTVISFDVAAAGWYVVDVSGLVPAGASGVLLQNMNTDLIYKSPSGYSGFRRGDSVSNLRDLVRWGFSTATPPSGFQQWCYVGLDSDRKFQQYRDKVFQFPVYYYPWQEVYIHGYFTDEAVFFQEPVDKTPVSAGAWVLTSCAAECPGATGLIFVGLGTTGNNYVRYPDASYSDRIGCYRGHAIVGCNSSQEVELYKANASSVLYLLGYIKSGFSRPTDRIALNVPIGIWTEMDVSAYIPSTLNGVFVHLSGADYTFKTIGLRRSGSALALLGAVSSSQALVNVIDRKFEMYRKEGTQYVLGWLKPEAPTNLVAKAISDAQIDVSWTRGAGALNTVVRRKIGSYPTDVADGDEAYNGPSDAFSDTGLDPSTTYYYRAWGYTDPHYSDDYAEDSATTFIAPPAIVPPSVTTESANTISQPGATVNGVLNDDGGEACDCWFAYGVPGGTIYTTPLQTKSSGELFSQALIGLTPGTRYHFRAVARNSTGITYGANKYFVTESPPLRKFSVVQQEFLELLRR